MGIYSVVIGCSILLQTISAVLTVRLLLRPGRRIAGLVILTAISLMTFRRAISLWRALTENAAMIDLPTEFVALIISLLFLIGIIYITRLIKAQEKIATTLQDSEERYHTLFSQSPDGILLTDTDGKIIDFNEAAHSRRGYSREEFAKLSLSDIEADDSHEKIQACIKKVLTEGKAAFEVRHRTKHGEIRDINVNIQTIILSGRTFFHMICHDLTEQKRAAEALGKNQKLLETIFDAAPT